MTTQNSTDTAKQDDDYKKLVTQMQSQDKQIDPDKWNKATLDSLGGPCKTITRAESNDVDKGWD